MRFTGTVLAVLLANILTIALLTGAYVYLRSDHGQMLLYELGLHSIYLSLAASIHDPEVESIALRCADFGMLNIKRMGLRRVRRIAILPVNAMNGSQGGIVET